MNRKQRRARNRIKKKIGKKATKLESKLGLFELLPKDCVICHEPFDKTSREMVSTWKVVVREEEKKVRVYCPGCWKKATDLLEEIGNRDNEAKTEGED
tara:strand:+ start:2686 stop:2979 length:294 start_codon:yes stop_codon:yes gene_type:complete